MYSIAQKLKLYLLLPTFFLFIFSETVKAFSSNEKI